MDPDTSAYGIKGINSKCSVIRPWWKHQWIMVMKIILITGTKISAVLWAWTIRAKSVSDDNETDDVQVYGYVT